MVSKKTLGTIDTWKRSLRDNWNLYKQSKMGIIAIIIILMFVFMAIFAPYLADRDPMNYRAPDEDVYTSQGAWAKYMNATPADFQTGNYENLTTGATTVFSSYAPIVHVVYVGTDRGNVYSLNTIDGFPSWIKTVDNSNITVIHGENEAGVGLDPYLYVGTENGNLVKLHDSSKVNTTTNHTEGYGVIEWNRPTGSKITAKPIVDQQTHTVYVANWNGEVFAIDTTSGSVKWQVSLHSPVLADMALSNNGNTLYIGTAGESDGRLYVINTTKLVYNDSVVSATGDERRASFSYGDLISYTIYKNGTTWPESGDVSGEVLVNATGDETSATFANDDLVSYSIYKNGTAWPENGNYTVDMQSGTVTFTNPLGVSDNITARYTFKHYAVDTHNGIITFTYPLSRGDNITADYKCYYYDMVSQYDSSLPLKTGVYYDEKLGVLYYTLDDTLYSRNITSSGALSDATTLKLSGVLTAPTVDIHTGSLYLASSDGSVFSVRPDMTVRWKNETNMGSITIPPVYSDKLDLLYLGTSTNNFITINANDGSIRILAKTVAPLSGQPLTVDAVPQEGAIKIDYQKGLFVTTRCSVELVNAAGKSALPLPPTWVESLPSGNTYLLGTDAQGRDIWSQLVYGSRVALLVGFAAAFFSITIGIVIGLVSGYFGKAIDSVLMRLADVILVLPFLPLVIILAAVLGPSIWNIVWAITLVGWPGVGRTIRAETLSLKERPYIDAARITGASHSRIMFRHIAPNVMPLAFLFATFSVSGAILTEAALSYIGLGDPTSMSWGMMLHTIQTSGAQLTAWWWLLPPGVAITLICLGFFMIGRAFDEIVNPRLRKR